MKDPEISHFQPKTYSVTDHDIIKISTLFGHLEDAIKEILRTQHGHHHDTLPQELNFYAETGRILYENETDISDF